MTQQPRPMPKWWPTLMWLIIILNVIAMLPQLWTLWVTRKTEGLSLSMIGIYLFIQIVIARDSYYYRNLRMQICMILSALVSASLIGSYLYLR